jgi:hypothetical protein
MATKKVSQPAFRKGSVMKDPGDLFLRMKFVLSVERVIGGGERNFREKRDKATSGQGEWIEGGREQASQGANFRGAFLERRSRLPCLTTRLY